MAKSKSKTRTQRIETYVDAVKDVIDVRDHMTRDEQLSPLNELVEYIRNVSIPDAEHAKVRR